VLFWYLLSPLLDLFQVPDGDSKVLVKEDEDEDDQDATAGSLPTEECTFSEGVVAVLLQVHPSHQISRNCQFVASDFVEFMLNEVGRQLLLTDEKVLSFESVLAVLPKILAGELVKYATSECSKENDPMLVDSIRQYMQSKFASIELSDRGLIAASKFLEYCLTEMLELGGNFSRDNHLSSVHPYHLFNIDDDEIEESFLEFCSMGSATRMINKHMVLKKEGIFTNDKENHDYFNQVFDVEDVFIN
jgi:hypothetical protein